MFAKTLQERNLYYQVPRFTGEAVDDESHLCELTQINRVAGILTLNLVPFVPYPTASEQQSEK